MTNNQLRLAADLLNMASDQFSNHGCNDFQRPGWFQKDEWEEMVRDCFVRNGDPENYSAGNEIFCDWWLMSHLAVLLKEKANRTDSFSDDFKEYMTDKLGEYFTKRKEGENHG